MTNMNTGSSKFEFQDLPPEVAKQIYTMEVGEVSKPFIMMDQMKNREVCTIVKLKSKTDVHKANLTDDFQVIKSLLEERLSSEFLHDWILKKQKETYIFIDEKWRGCDFRYPGWIHSN